MMLIVCHNQVRKFLQQNPLNGDTNSISERLVFEKIRENINSAIITSSPTNENGEKQNEIREWLDRELDDTTAKHNIILSMFG